MKRHDLIYGTPPAEADCRDGGHLDVFTVLGGNGDPEAPFSHLEETLGGKPLPKTAMIREAIYRLRNKKKPVKVVVNGLGTLLLGPHGYQLEGE